MGLVTNVLIVDQHQVVHKPLIMPAIPHIAGNRLRKRQGTKQKKSEHILFPPYRRYLKLLSCYGSPGPWPWFGQNKASNIDEIIIGTILTQNTNWSNVEKALNNLRKENFCSLKKIYTLAKKDIKKLKLLIYSTGYYNQKADRLFNLGRHIFSQHKSINNFFKLSLEQSREELLSITGIGKETADTILLYGGSKMIFVIDAYTIKFCQHFKLSYKTNYDDLQKYFMQRLPNCAQIYKDYHALIVQWGKRK